MAWLLAALDCHTSVCGSPIKGGMTAGNSSKDSVLRAAHSRTPGSDADKAWCMMPSVVLSYPDLDIQSPRANAWAHEP